jgi:hypothetical protein
LKFWKVKGDSFVKTTATDDLECREKTDLSFQNNAERPDFARSN